MTAAEFCRDLEAYLCRKNDGHLIRIVGPVFEKVCGWAAQGVPLKIAHRGIDRYFERQQASRRAGPSRRRPIRLEFCEADILDAFDEWRRAVGVGLAAGASGSDRSERGEGDHREGPSDAESRVEPGSPGPDVAAAGAQDAAVVERAGEGGGHARRKPALQTHIDRVMARLTQRRVEMSSASTSPHARSTSGDRAGEHVASGDEIDSTAARAPAGEGSGGRKTPGDAIDATSRRASSRQGAGEREALGDAIDRVLGELDTMRAGARGVRQEARAALVARLTDVDRALIEAARASLDPGALDELRREARRELEPFRSRLAPDAFAQAIESALDRLVRERLRLPSVRVDE